MNVMGKKEIIFIIITTIICVVLNRPEAYLLLLCYAVIFLSMIMLTIKDKIKDKRESKMDIMASKRTTKLIGKITKVQRELDRYDFIERVTIYCEYEDQYHKIYKFKSITIEGITDCKEGDSVVIMADPSDYSNYFVSIQDLVHD